MNTNYALSYAKCPEMLNRQMGHFFSRKIQGNQAVPLPGFFRKKLDSLGSRNRFSVFELFSSFLSPPPLFVPRSTGNQFFQIFSQNFPPLHKIFDLC